MAVLPLIAASSINTQDNINVCYHVGRYYAFSDPNVRTPDISWIAPPQPPSPTTTAQIYHTVLTGSPWKETSGYLQALY